MRKAKKQQTAQEKAELEKDINLVRETPHTEEQEEQAPLQVSSPHIRRAPVLDCSVEMSLCQSVLLWKPGAVPVHSSQKCVPASCVYCCCEVGLKYLSMGGLHLTSCACAGAGTGQAGAEGGHEAAGEAEDPCRTGAAAHARVTTGGITRAVNGAFFWVLSIFGGGPSIPKQFFFGSFLCY